MTLIELLVTVAVASLVVSAAVAVLVAMSRQMRASERRLEATNAAMLATAIIQADLTNAGYRFPVPAFALRHYNNVDATTSLSGPAPITVGGNCAGGTVGLVPGTDVLEVIHGFELVGPGRAEGLINSNPPAEYEIALGTLGLPFETAEFLSGAVGSIVALSGPDQRACVGRVLAADGLRPSITIELVDRNLQRITDPNAYPVVCPIPGGTGGTRVYRLQRRVRFMVCGRIGADPNEYALYRQESDLRGDFGAPQVVQEGVEDLQVSLGYSDPNSLISATGSGASCTGTGGARICYCDDAVGPSSCTMPPDQLEPDLGTTRTIDTVSDPAIAVWTSRVRGARVVVTGIGQRAAHDLSTGRSTMSDDLRRPAAFDHAEMPVASKDGYLRSQQFSAFYVHNFEVVP
ncbi:MAG: hypothetical protein AB1730_14100 [Myxococcota bacterium]